LNSVGTRDRPTFENEKNHFQKYRKIIVTGHIIEVYEMEKTPYQLLAGRKKSELDWINDYVAEVQDMDLLDKLAAANERGASAREINDLVWKHNGRISHNITRTRNNLRRLAIANFDATDSRFATFTFRENITDVKTANKYWWLFMKKMRRKFGSFKYIAVIEFQKRGAVHYHCIWDLPFIKAGELEQLWGNGFIKINRIEHVDNVGAYMVKYMTKELFDDRFMAIKAYQCSQGLERPLELRGEQAESIMSIYGLGQKKCVFESCYTSEYTGLIEYREYNLKRAESQREQTIRLQD